MSVEKAQRVARRRIEAERQRREQERRQREAVVQRDVENQQARQRYLAKLEAEKAEGQRQRQAQQEQQAAKKQQHVKVQLRVACLTKGWTEAEFEQRWPELWEEYMRKETQDLVRQDPKTNARLHGYSL
jgi:hypothetical protein